MYFSPNWQNQLLYKLLPSRQLLNELMPLRGLARKLSHTGTDSLDGILYRDLAPQTEPSLLVPEGSPAAEYPTMPELYQQPDFLEEPASLVGFLRSDERGFATSPLPPLDVPMTPAAEINAAINEIRAMPDPFEPSADELFPPMFEAPF